MNDLEARKAELFSLLDDAPQDVPDLLPSASAIYAGQVARLTEALNSPEERTEAAEVLRTPIERSTFNAVRRTEYPPTGSSAKLLELLHKQNLPQHRLPECR
ncbi:hypothetical protein ELG69_28930 [Rhizobium leguminosarum]|uniref:hypothetical protein n=1 Tax=Rhizobium leguminosarum TaxID=384 RepID=UPI00102FAA8F|nr:hypothetical protein [Rhizobium leguminosarum]TBG74375.1 hypothetical protein ELG69_28930 [Rhizobium leguminosarum]